MINLFWWNQERNFGDELAPVICQCLSGQEMRYTDAWGQCDLTSIGSILHLVDPNCFRGGIWGSGLIKPAENKRFPHARVFAVRGTKTRSALNLNRYTPLGDPGILCHLLAQNRPKKYRVGIIAHFVDKGHPAIATFAEKSTAIKVIDVKAGFQTVLDQISECDMIISSAMHGLIAADSLGIPNAWIELSNNVLGDGFKFQDYYSAFGMTEVKPIDFDATDDIESIEYKLSNYDRPNIAAVKENLIKSFPIKQNKLNIWWKIRRVRRMIAAMSQRFKQPA